MNEKFIIGVDTDGTSKVKDDFKEVGKVATRAAEDIRKSFKDALKGLNDPQTNLKQAASIAINSFKQQEQAAKQAAAEQVRAAREAQRAQEQAARETARAQKQAYYDAQATERAVIASSLANFRDLQNRKRAMLREEVAAERAAANDRKAADKADALANAPGDTSAATTLIGRGLALVGIKKSAEEFILLSDAMENTRNRLRVVTKDEAEMNSVMQKLRGVALENRTEFDTTTRTYARMAQSTKALGLSQRDNIDLTSTLTKAIAVGGSTAEEAHATLIQLSQAFASNRLSGDEFRSVAEQMPIVLDLIAKATGKPRTELKAMGQEGKLNTALLVRAILEGSEDIEKSFKKTIPTIEQAWQNVKTQGIFAVDSFNKASGASHELVTALQYVATHMDTVVGITKVLGELIGVYMVSQVLALSKSFAALALSNPFTAIAGAMLTAYNVTRTYRDTIREVLGIHKEITLDYDANGLFHTQIAVRDDRDRVVKNPLTGGMERRGDEKAVARRAQLQKNVDNDQALIHQEYQDDERKKLIKRLKQEESNASFQDAIEGLKQKVADIKLTKAERARLAVVMKEEVAKIETELKRKLTTPETDKVRALATQEIKDRRKRGTHKLTFDEAVEPLEDEVAGLQLNRVEREKLAAVMKLEERLHRNLTDSERDYVMALVSTQKEMKNKEEFDKKMFADWLKRQEERAKWMKEIARLDEEQKAKDAKNTKKLKEGHTRSFNTEDEIDNAVYLVRTNVARGNISKQTGLSDLQKLELQDPRTPKIRKEFLEEFTENGKTAQGIMSIFGPEGTLSKGLSNAVAQTAVFHKSFKSALQDLGKTIQAEVIQTLVQALIRMAILSALGGGKATGVAGAAASAISGIANLPKKASGGYAYGSRGDIAGLHHGGEFVINAAATAQNRQMLEDVNAGRTVNSGMTVNVINQHSGAEVEARYVSHNEVEIIARRVSREEAPRAAANAMRDPNSRMSKALGMHTTARRTR